MLASTRSSRECCVYSACPNSESEDESSEGPFKEEVGGWRLSWILDWVFRWGEGGDGVSQCMKLGIWKLQTMSGTNPRLQAFRSSPSQSPALQVSRPDSTFTKGERPENLDSQVRFEEDMPLGSVSTRVEVDLWGQRTGST